jgi:hypothetical protein
MIWDFNDFVGYFFIALVMSWLIIVSIHGILRLFRDLVYGDKAIIVKIARPEE